MRLFYFSPPPAYGGGNRVRDKIVALDNLGWDYFDCIYTDIISKWGWANGLEKIGKKIREFNPEVIYLQKAQGITKDFLNRVKGDAKVFQWFGDISTGSKPQLHRSIEEKIGGLDALGISNCGRLDYYRDQGIPKVFEWHCAVNPGKMKDYPIRSKYDIVFGGNDHSPDKYPDAKDRAKMLVLLSQNFNLLIHGKGWAKHRLKSKQVVVDKEYGKVLRSAKITLGYNNNHAISNYYDWRLFQCMAVGRLHLTRYVKDMERDFENRKHLVWFHTHKEALDLVRYYLNHESEREKIGMEGRKLIVGKHTWEHRFKELEAKLL